MKNILILLSILFSFSAQAVITNPASNFRDNLGTVTLKDKIDVKVYNGTGSAISAGQIVVHDTTNDDGMNVTTSTTEGAKAYCIAVAAIADGASGRCRVYGYHSAVLYSAWGGSATAGQAVYHSSDALAGYASRIVSNRTFENTAFPVGVVLDTVSTTTTVEMFIDIK